MKEVIPWLRRYFLVGCNCSEAGQQLTSHPCTCYLGVENLSIVLINLNNTGFLSLFISHTLMPLLFLYPDIYAFSFIPATGR